MEQEQKQEQYTYIVEQNASKIFNIPSNKQLNINIFCYSINNDIINPFLLFMFEEINNILYFPKFILNCDEEFNIEDKLTNLFSGLFTYHGIIINGDDYYCVVRIDDIHNFYNNIYKNNYFALATEIINNKKIFNYSFSNEIINLFINNPSFYSLVNENTNYCYKLPDVVYKYVGPDEVNYYLNFGNKKEKFFESCDEYYFFNRRINNSLRYVTLIRYALFTGNKIHFENNDELILNDREIDEILENDRYKTIIISYLNQNHNYPDILVKNYNNFIPLSYITLN